MLMKRYYTKKEFRILVIGALLTIIAYILFVGNNINPDYLNYQRHFYNGTVSFEDGLLKSLTTFIFFKLGFSYQGYLGVVAILTFFLLWKVISYYTEGSALAFLLYMLYPFLLDIVQIDNFLTYTIVLFGLRYLDEEYVKKGIFKYTITIVVAALVHPLAVIYLIFLLKFIKDKKKLNVIIAVFALFEFLYAAVIPKVIAYIPFLNRFATQLGYYLRYKADFQHGMMLYALMLVVLYIICSIKQNLMVENMMNTAKDDTLIKIMLISLCFIPLILISSEFVRTVRNLWIIYYCYLLSQKNIPYRKVFTLIAIMIAVFLAIKDLGPSSFYFEPVTRTVLENNIFW